MMIYPAKVTEIKRLSPHAQITVKPVRVTAPTGAAASARG
jgi:hypothetical protein